jgi:hypothetical protein
MPYPDYPDQRLIVNGIDLTETFGLIMVDGYTLSPPEPKTIVVDSNSIDGVFDLTEAVLGDVCYKNRSQSFSFYKIGTTKEEFETLKRQISNFLNGRKYDYTLSFDPGYTYTGRFTVSSYAESNNFGVFQISIDAEPYKFKGDMTYSIDVTYPKLMRVACGRKSVRPIITCTQPIYFWFNGVAFTVSSGIHRLVKALFREGVNEFYIASQFYKENTWATTKSGGSNHYTWEYLNTEKYRYTYLYSDKNKGDYSGTGDALATLTYPWKDL